MESIVVTADESEATLPEDEIRNPFLDTSHEGEIDDE